MVTHPLLARHRAVLSCMRCHGRKKKCNRMLPCNNCIRQGAECIYDYMEREVFSGLAKRSSLRKVCQVLGEGSGSTLAATLGLPSDAISYLAVWNNLESSMKCLSSGPALLIPCPGNSISYLIQSFPLLFHLRSGYCVYQPRIIDPLLLYSEVLQTNSAKHAAVYLGARMYAAQLGAAHGQLPEGSCLRYKAEAIYAIKQAIESSVVISDEDIIAVIFMAMSYNKYLDNQGKWKAHTEGIKKMIAVRGGWDSIGYNGLIKDLYTWCIKYGRDSTLCASFAPDI